MRCVTLDNETTTGLHSREQVHTLVAMVCCCNRYCHCDWHGSDSPMEVGARARVCVRVCVCADQAVHVLRAAAAVRCDQGSLT